MRRTTNRSAALPRPEFRQQFPYLSIDRGLNALHDQIRMMQKACGDGDYTEILNTRDAQAMMRALEKVRLRVEEAMQLLPPPTHCRQCGQPLNEFDGSYCEGCAGMREALEG